MGIFKKFFTILFGLQLAGCASSSDINYYVLEDEFKSEYHTAQQYIKNGLYSKALILLNELEQDNYAPAIYRLYQMYNNGEGVPENKEKSLLLLEKAFNLKYPLAEYDMAMKRLKKRESINKSIEILQKLILRLENEKSGEEHVFYKLLSKTYLSLAQIYFEGKHIPRDLKKADEYGYVIGSLPTTQEGNIGKELLGNAYILYGKILEVRKDTGLKNRWDSFVAFGNAIEVSNNEGYYQKGLVYLKEKNFQFSADAFGLGCSSGHAQSCYEAGVLYEENKVYKYGDKNEWGEVKENPLVIARRYYTEGAKLGNSKCKEKLSLLKKL